MSIKTKFCPNCGKEVKTLIKGLCEDCFREKTPVGYIPEKIALDVCPKCGKYMKDNRWFRQSYLPGTIKTIIKKSMVMKGQGTFSVKLDEDMKQARVKTRWFMDDKQEIPTEAEHEVDISVRKRLCDECFRKYGGYYEAVIQFRGKDEEVERAIRDVKALEGRGDKWFVAKTIKVKGGYDINIGSKDMGRKIEQMFRGCEIKRSYSLVTKRDGRDLYRNTILIRLPDA